MLQIFNSLSGRKETFEPIHAGKVRMYVCGITVYDYCHIGHARVLVVFDVIYRYFRASGYEVTYVRNITDIDDKIIKRAAENGEPISDLTDRFIRFMDEDSAALSVLRPTMEPRATTHIEQINQMIERLLARGHAYQATNGDVYYDVSSFSSYGKLSGKKPAELRAGARVDVEELKDDPLDFVLWKAAKPGEPAWESPFGPGRPGWHIECSAMSTHCLGNQFDIHGGGQDLQFPHHENEIAQSEGASGEEFARYWIHNGFVRVDDEKMSKSLGNFFTIREVIATGYDAETIRFFVLTSHYRSQLNYSEENLSQARNALNGLKSALEGLPSIGKHHHNSYEMRFRSAMDDDFNTPEALSVLFELRREVNKLKETAAEKAGVLAGSLVYLGHMLGILETIKSDDEIYGMVQAWESARQQNDQVELDRLARELDRCHMIFDSALTPPAWRRLETFTRPANDNTEVSAGLSEAEIEKLVEARTAARERKDWPEADRLRRILAEHHITIDDTPKGTKWRVARN